MYLTRDPTSEARFMGCLGILGYGARSASRYALHVAVIYVPFMQRAFSTTNLAASDWLLTARRGQFRSLDSGVE